MTSLKNCKLNKKILGNFLFLFPYCLLLIKSALGNTTFLEYINTNSLFFKSFYIVSIITIGLKVLWIDRFSTKDAVNLVFTSFLSLITFVLNRNTSLLILFILLIGAKNVKLDKIVKWHLIIYLSILLVSLICSQVDIIENYVIHNNGNGVRQSLGNTYPTDFAAGVFFLMLDWYFLSFDKLNKKHALFFVFVGVLTYILTKANTSFIFILLLSSIIIFKAYVYLKIDNELLKKITSFVLVFFSSISILFSFVDPTKIPILSFIDRCLSYRLSYNYLAVQKYGIGFFGTLKEMTGGGWATDYSSATYFYVDNNYIYALLIFGLIPLIYFLIAYFKSTTCKNDYKTLLCLFVIYSFCFMEPRLLNILYNPFIFIITHNYLYSESNSNNQNSFFMQIKFIIEKRNDNMKIVQRIKLYTTKHQSIQNFLRYIYALIKNKDRLQKRVSFGNLNKDKTIYVIRPNSEDGIQGLMSLLIQTLRKLEYAQRKNYTPYIDFKNYKTQYYKEGVNAWELFFEQPSGLTYDEVYASNKVILSGLSLKKLENNHLYKGTIFSDSDLCKKCHDIFENNIKFSKDVEDVIEKELNEIDIDNCVGVYVRGTDYIKLKPVGEYVQPTATMIIDKMKEFEEKYPHTNFFLVTEDFDIYTQIQEEFKDKIKLVSFDSFVKNYTGEQYLGLTNHLSDDRKKRGVDYLVKIILLSRCRYLISSITMGSIACYAINGDVYDDKYIFNLGVYK